MNFQKTISKLLFSISFFILSYATKAQITDSVKIDAVEVEASYSFDGVSNFSGGQKQGGAAMGIIDVAMTVNTEGLGMWKGGSLYAQVENTHGNTPSSSLIGDLQAFDNMENGDGSYLYMLWYKQTLGPVDVTVGVHDLNSEFLTSDLAGNFINSSFGIMPVVSLNIPVSIFPENGLGAILKYNISESFAIQTALYDGMPADEDTDPYNLKWALSSKEGLLSVSEIHYSTEKEGNVDGIYKLGFVYHSGSDFQNFKNNTQKKRNIALYALADKNVFMENANDEQGLGCFIKGGYAPSSYNLNDFFLGAGLVYTGLIPKRDNDITGLAVAYAHITNAVAGASSETAIEFTYTLNLHDNISIQPDFQYIINPGGFNTVKNAFVGLIRLSISI